MAEHQHTSPTQDPCCLNPACPDYHKTDHGNIIKAGRTPQGNQRYKCKTCKHTFSAAKGTLHYRRRTAGTLMLEAACQVKEKGESILSIAEEMHVKPDTVRGWLKAVETHPREYQAFVEAWQPQEARRERFSKLANTLLKQKRLTGAKYMKLVTWLERDPDTALRWAEHRLRRSNSAD